MSLLSSIFGATNAQPVFAANSTAKTTPTSDATKSNSSAFGPACVLDISGATPPAATAATDPSKKKEGDDALLALIQQLLTSMQEYLQNIGADSQKTSDVAATSSNDNSSSDALAALSGPVSNAQVEAFLGQVENQPNISADQKKQVDDMMAQYKNVPTTSAMLESIQATLASSGILPIA